MATCKSLSVSEILSFYLAFLKLPRIKKQGKLFEEFLSIVRQIALCGVVGSERVFKRVWDTSRLPARSALNGRHWRPTPQQAKSVRQVVARTGRFCLLRNLAFSKYGKGGKRMDWKLEIKNSGYLPEKGKPTEETVKPPNDKQG